MRFDADRVRKMMTYQYDPGSSAPSPKHRHLERFRKKEFEASNIAELYHENTKYTERDSGSDLSTISLFVADETMQLVQSVRRNDYQGRETIPLPEPEPKLGVDLGTALDRRRSRRVYDGRPISLQALSTLLGRSLGTNGAPEGSATRVGRTYPSGGGLYPIESYVAVVNGGPELTEGLYYYAAEDHVLRVLDDDITDDIETAFDPPERLDPRDSAICLLFTGALWRTQAKYGPRGYRFALQESGHAGQNVQLVADALGFGSVPIAAVQEDVIEDALGIDGVNETLLYAMFVGSPPVESDHRQSPARRDRRSEGGDRHE